MNEAAQVLIGGLSLGAVYFLLGAGVSLVFGQSRIVNFAHGQFLVISGFTTWAIARSGVPLLVALVVGVLVVALLAVVMERFVLRHVIESPFTAFLVSLGLFLILEQGVIDIWGGTPEQVSSPVSGSWALGGINIPKTTPVMIGSAIVIGAVLAFTVRRSRMGRMIRASAEDAFASRYSGINVSMIRSVAFAFGSGVAGLAGVLLALEYPIAPYSGETYLITGFVIALIGGLGSLAGAAVGGVVLALAETIGQAYGAGEWVSAISLGLLVLVLIIRPGGLFSRFSGAIAEAQTVLVGTTRRLGSGPVRSVAVVAGFSVLLFVLPLVGLGTSTLSILEVALIFGIVAYSVALLYRLTGLLSFGSGAFMGIGAFTSAIFVGSWHWDFWLSLMATLATCAVLGALTGLLLSRTRGLYFLIVTFALADGAALIEQNLSVTGGASGMTITSNFGSIFGITFGSGESIYYLSATVLAVVVVAVWLICRSKFGQRAQTLRENEKLAASLGVGPLPYIVIAFTVSAVIAGMGGVLYLYQDLAISPSLFTALATVSLPLMVILGGVLAPSGPLVGALALLLVPHFLNFNTNAETYVYGAIIVVVMLGARGGLVPFVDDVSSRLVARFTRQLRPAEMTVLPSDRLLTSAAVEPGSARRREAAAGAPGAGPGR